MPLLQGDLNMYIFVFTMSIIISCLVPLHNAFSQAASTVTLINNTAGEENDVVRLNH